MLDYTHQDWKARAERIAFRGQAFIDGRFLDAVSGKTFDSINPATGEVLTAVSECDAADIDRAVAAGRRAFEDGRWSRMAPGDRKAVLLRLADLIRANLEEMALLDSLDMGKLVTDAAAIDAPGSAHFFQWYAECIDKLYDEVAPTGPATSPWSDGNPWGSSARCRPGTWAGLSRHAPVAKAMNYMLKRWDGFTRFLTDGRVCLTNNAAERALRGIALGRKAWLFAGSDRGGERAAFMYGLIGTAKFNSVDPQAWLADVLDRIAGTPASRLDDLLPWNWRPMAGRLAA